MDVAKCRDLCHNIFPCCFFSETVKRGGFTSNRAGAVGPSADLGKVQRVEGGKCALVARDLQQGEPAGGTRGRKCCRTSHCCSCGRDQFIKTLTYLAVFGLSGLQTHTMNTRTAVTHSFDTLVPYKWIF